MDVIAQFPRERTWLLPALQAAQRAEGWLSPENLVTVALHLKHKVTVLSREKMATTFSYIILRFPDPASGRSMKGRLWSSTS